MFVADIWPSQTHRSFRHSHVAEKKSMKTKYNEPKKTHVSNVRVKTKTTQCPPRGDIRIVYETEFAHKNRPAWDINMRWRVITTTTHGSIEQQQCAWKKHENEIQRMKDACLMIQMKDENDTIFPRGEDIRTVSMTKFAHSNVPHETIACGEGWWGAKRGKQTAATWKKPWKHIPKLFEMTNYTQEFIKPQHVNEKNQKKRILANRRRVSRYSEEKRKNNTILSTKGKYSNCQYD